MFNTKQPSYQSLRDIITERTTQIVAWVGAGLSKEVGFPSWTELRDNLLDVAKKSIEIDQKNEAIYEYKMATLEQISKIKNLWTSFQRLKSFLGTTSFRDTIRKELQTSPSKQIPDTYLNLWMLNLSGLINLNIDRMATRAWMKQKIDIPPTEFSGKQIKNYTHILNSPNQFIVNLHGNHEDYSSWVFCKSDLKKLFDDQGYNNFIKSVLSTRVVIFIGISTDDLAVGGHLEYLSKQGIDFGVHYWITPRVEESVKKWAEKSGIRLIHYELEDGSHKTQLAQLFEDLKKYLPKDKPVHPIVPEINNHTDEVIENKELLKMSAEEIRLYLNKKAKDILKDNSSKTYKQYDLFFKKYEESIFRAWYTNDKQGENILLGYKLIKEKGKGSFGRIYQAEDEQGNEVAIKVLLVDERKKMNFLQSFRRGVRSMKILAEHKVNGMVAYKDAYEIPTFVVMEWINGPNLYEAVESKNVETWDMVLKISSELSKIIHTAHQLPERVLHRDIRPPNIMLKNFYSEPNNWEVVVLDFDLSWHLGAQEDSIQHGNSMAGYLAPEQLRIIKNVSTRNSAVDSFCLGMTLYYILTKRDPFPSEHKYHDWKERVNKATQNIKINNWHSLPRRFARLIINATKHEQYERWDLGQIVLELERLSVMNLTPEKIFSAELLAEEIIARSCYNSQYVWDENKLKGSVKSDSGLNLEIIGNESAYSVNLKVMWIGQNQDTTKNLKKWIPDTMNKCLAALKNSGWKNVQSSHGEQIISIETSIDIDKGFETIDKLVDSLNNISKHFSFV